MNGPFDPEETENGSGREPEDPFGDNSMTWGAAEPEFDRMLWERIGPAPDMPTPAYAFERVLVAGRRRRARKVWAARAPRPPRRHGGPPRGPPSRWWPQPSSTGGGLPGRRRRARSLESAVGERIAVRRALAEPVDEHRGRRRQHGHADADRHLGEPERDRRAAVPQRHDAGDRQRHRRPAVATTQTL